MLKLVIIPYEFKTFDRSCKLFIKLMNMNFDVSIDTNFNSNFDNKIKDYDESFKKIIVFEKEYVLLDNDIEKIIDFSEIIDLKHE